MLKNTPSSYGLISKITHGLIASLIIIILILGFIMTNLPKDSIYKLPLIITHKSLGVLAAILAPLVIIWSIISLKPAYPKSMASISIFAAVSVRYLLLLIVAIMPWSGYIMATSANRQAHFFNLFTFPSIINATPAVGKLAYAIHVFCAPVAAGLIIMHILAALKHHFIDKNKILRRMFF
jgi:cytochrome b561